MEIVGYEVVEARIPESLDSGSVKKTDVETDEIDESVLDVMKKVWNFEHIQIIDRIDYLKTKEKRYTKM